MTEKRKPNRSRRANGEGSIFQRSDGKWVGEVTLWEGPTRKRRKVVGRTRGEVDIRLKELMVRINDGGTIESDRLTVAAWLDEWLTKEAAPKVRPRTLSGYQQIVTQHLSPGLGHHLLRNLKSRHIRDYLAAKSAETSTSKGKAKGRTLSARSVQLHHAVLRRALNVAVSRGLVKVNEAALISPPSVRRAERQPLTPEQCAVFLQSVAGHRHEWLFRVAMATGARQSELLGIKWADVDFETGTLQIARSLQRYGGEYHLDEVKNARSRRTIALPAPALEAFRRQSTSQKADRFAAGEVWQGNKWELIFADAMGSPLSGVVITHHFQDALKRAGLPKVRFHDLRHGTATYLLGAGVDVRTVMDILGHSTISTTMDIYAHVIPQHKKDAADRLSAVLFG